MQTFTPNSSVFLSFSLLECLGGIHHSGTTLLAGDVRRVCYPLFLHSVVPERFEEATGRACLYPRGDPGNEDVQKCHGLSSLYPFRLPQNMRISSYFIAPILPPHLGTCWNTRCCVSAAKLLQLWFGVTARRESWELRVRRCKDTCGSMLRRQWSMPFQCKEESHFRTT